VGEVQGDAAMCFEGAFDYDLTRGVGWSCWKNRCGEVNDYTGVVEGAGGQTREYFY